MLRAFFFAPNLRSRSSRSEPSRIKEGTRKSAFFWFVPPASPRQPFPNPRRRAAHQSSSLFPLPSFRPGLPLPLPGSARELLSAGGRRISSPAAIRNCKTPFPPHGPACRAQACSEPVPQSGTPQLFTLHYSLFPIRSPSPAPLFPPGRTAKQKYILFFGHLTHNSTRYNIGLNLIMEGKEYGKTGSA